MNTSSQNYETKTNNHQYHRIIRFVTTPMVDGGDRLVARLDEERNVLEVDQGIYDLLPDYQQRQILHAPRNVVLR